ncbi:MAG: 3-phosphoshikimate 1-carboxyvinyltransferase, partial [Candidatus Rokubacteria bacterium]|nr:3-phosphoshikimate 1-carboxyvinyltransferase [Candidatus Rokubacteria bacterium]
YLYKRKEIAEVATYVHVYLESDDCLRTLRAVEALGAEVTRKGPGEYRIAGAGPRGFSEPADVLDCGNSGTTARLLLGVLAAQPFWTFLTGDESLRRRPMARVVAPLAAMGATVVGRADAGRLPLGIRGGPLRALHWDLPVASAQVKSAILLAGLHADGPVSVTEPAASRDHSERLLRRFGARLERRGLTTTIEPGRLVATSVRVPGDISSAAFLLVAGAIVADSRVTVSGVGLNPTRTGVLEVLEAMGARLSITPAGDADADEPAGDVTVTAGELRGTRIAGSLIPRLIDEIPALAVAAACARGRTDVRDAAELRVKESDRVAVLARELGRLGARVAEQPDGLVVEGGGPLVGARVSSDGDHRIAMALAVAALVARGTTVIEDAGCIATSFPQFPECLNRLAGEPVAVLEP